MIGAELTDDAGRCAAALILAVLHNDTEGIRVICTDPPRGLPEVLAGMALGALQLLAVELGHDNADEVVEEQLAGFLQQVPQT